MDGLEPHDEYLELLERVPGSLEWGILEERDDGYDVWVTAATGVPPSGLVHGFSNAGFLDAGRLRLGVSRVLWGITRTPDDVTVFKLRASRAHELDAQLLDVIVQAGLFGEMRYEG
jgi:hypothetical protein